MVHKNRLRHLSHEHTQLGHQWGLDNWVNTRRRHQHSRLFAVLTLQEGNVTKEICRRVAFRARLLTVYVALVRNMQHFWKKLYWWCLLVAGGFRKTLNAFRRLRSNTGQTDPHRFNIHTVNFQIKVVDFVHWAFQLGSSHKGVSLSSEGSHKM